MIHSARRGREARHSSLRVGSSPLELVCSHEGLRSHHTDDTASQFESMDLLISSRAFKIIEAYLLAQAELGETVLSQAMDATLWLLEFEIWPLRLHLQL